MTEEYDLTPHRKIEELENELEQIKKHPFGSASEGKHLLDAILMLNDSINSLIEVFKESAEKLGSDEQPESVDSKNEDVGKKIDELVEQNKDIAEALVSLADELKEHKETESRPQAKPVATPKQQQSYPTGQAQFVPGPPLRPQQQSMPRGMPPGSLDQSFPPLDSGLPDMPDFGDDLGMPSFDEPSKPGIYETASPPAPPKKKSLFSFKK